MQDDIKRLEIGELKRHINASRGKIGVCLGHYPSSEEEINELQTVLRKLGPVEIEQYHDAAVIHPEALVLHISLGVLVLLWLTHDFLSEFIKELGKQAGSGVAKGLATAFLKLKARLTKAETDGTKIIVIRIELDLDKRRRRRLALNFPANLTETDVQEAIARILVLVRRLPEGSKFTVPLLPDRPVYTYDNEHGWRRVSRFRRLTF